MNEHTMISASCPVKNIMIARPLVVSCLLNKNMFFGKVKYDIAVFDNTALVKLIINSNSTFANVCIDPGL